MTKRCEFLNSFDYPSSVMMKGCLISAVNKAVECRALKDDCPKTRAKCNPTQYCWQVKKEPIHKICDTCENLEWIGTERKCTAGVILNPYIWGCVDQWKQKSKIVGSASP